MFTREHYEFLAARINASLKVVWNSDVPDGIQVYTLLSFAEILASTLQADNSLFQPWAFYEAICKDTPYSITNMDSYRKSYLGGISVLEKNIDPALKQLVRELHQTG